MNPRHKSPRRKITTDPATGELRIDPAGMSKAEKILASLFDPSLTADMDPLTPLDDPESMEEILTEHMGFARDLGFSVPLSVVPEPFRTEIEDARSQEELDEASDALNAHYKLSSYDPPMCFVVTPSPDGRGEPHITLTKA
jgi:hypothetical protein